MNVGVVVFYWVTSGDDISVHGDVSVLCVITGGSHSISINILVCVCVRARRVSMPNVVGVYLLFQ